MKKPVIKNKSAWIRKVMPLNWSAAYTVKRAKELGMDISENFVYAVRSLARARAKKKREAKAKNKRPVFLGTVVGHESAATKAKERRERRARVNKNFRELAREGARLMTERHEGAEVAKDQSFRQLVLELGIVQAKKEIADLESAFFLRNT